MTISQATAFLESAYSKLNEIYFENTLPKAIITIQSSTRAYGHFTIVEAWADKKKRMYHEINIGAEHLNRPVAETIGTLIHEMVHFYCKENGIQDTSRGMTYHNKRFKAEAEKRGLIIQYNEKIGFSITSPSPELKSLCAKQHWNGKLTINRLGEIGDNEPATERPKKKSSTRKYICPTCGNSVRATKEVNIMCLDCSCEMVTAS